MMIAVMSMRSAEARGLLGLWYSSSPLPTETETVTAKSQINAGVPQDDPHRQSSGADDDNTVESQA